MTPNLPYGRYALAATEWPDLQGSRYARGPTPASSATIGVLRIGHICLRLVRWPPRPGAISAETPAGRLHWERRDELFLIVILADRHTDVSVTINQRVSDIQSSKQWISWRNFLRSDFLLPSLWELKWSKAIDESAAAFLQPIIGKIAIPTLSRRPLLILSRESRVQRLRARIPRDVHRQQRPELKSRRVPGFHAGRQFEDPP
jgi:hypothetical protein